MRSPTGGGRHGLPALSIDWGAWSDVGMAAAQDDRDRSRWSSRGVGTIAPSEGLERPGALMRLPADTGHGHAYRLADVPAPTAAR